MTKFLKKLNFQDFRNLSFFQFFQIFFSIFEKFAFLRNTAQKNFLIAKTLISSTNDNELYPQNAFLTSEHVPENLRTKVPRRRLDGGRQKLSIKSAAIVGRKKPFAIASGNFLFKNRRFFHYFTIKFAKKFAKNEFSRFSKFVIFSIFFKFFSIFEKIRFSRNNA